MAIGIFASGLTIGIKWEEGKQAVAEKQLVAAVDAANKASAEAIASIKPKYTTIKNEVQREIQTHHEYTDCRLTPNGLRHANEALTGAKPSSEGELPSTVPTGK